MKKGTYVCLIEPHLRFGNISALKQKITQANY